MRETGHRKKGLRRTGLVLLLAVCTSTAFAEGAKSPARRLGELGAGPFKCSSPPTDLLWPTQGGGPIAFLEDGRPSQWDAESGVRVWRGKRILPGGVPHAFSADGACVAWLARNALTIAPLRGGEPVVFEGAVPPTFSQEMLAVSRDGRRVAAAFAEGLVVWDAKTGKKESSRNFDDTHTPRRIVFSEDGDSILLQRDSHPLSRFSATDDTALPEEVDPQGGNGTGLLTSSAAVRFIAEDSLDLVDLGTGKSTHFATKVESDVFAVSRDGNLFAVAHPSGILQLWNARTGALLHEINGPWGILDRLAISPDGKRVAGSGRASFAVFVIDVETGLCVPGLDEETGAIARLAASRDGRFLAALSETNAVSAWEISSKRQLWRTRAVGDGPRDIVFWPDGTRILVACDAGLEIFDARTGRLLKHLKDEHGPVRFSRDGLRLARGMEGGFGICMAATLMEDGAASSSYATSLTVDFTEDERGLFIIGATGDRSYPADWELVLGATAPGGADRAPLKLADVLAAAAFSPDRRLLALRLVDSTRVVDARTGLPIFDLKEPTAWLNLESSGMGDINIERVGGVFLAWSADGKLLYSHRSPGKLGVIDVETGDRVLTIDGLAGPFALIPGTPTLAMAGKAGRIQLWDSRLPAHPGPGPGEPLLADAWSQLGVRSGRVAHRAATALARSGDAAAAFLEGKLRIDEAPATDVDRFIARLADDNVEARVASEAALRALGTRAEPALRRALAGANDPEARARIEALLLPLLEPTARTADQRRNDWAIRILEDMRALDALRRIAGGDVPGRTRVAASAAFERLKGKK